MIYKDIGLVKDIAISTNGLESDINSVAAVLSYTVCHINNGIFGKKQIEIVKFYEKLNQEQLNSTGYELSQLSTKTFQFILTCIEFFGFTRKERVDRSIMVDVSSIEFSDL